MPLYEYRCTSCDYKFEKIQKFSDAPERVCPKCQGELVRPVTAPAIKFEGAGWYINDYAPKSSGAAANSETKTEKSESKSSEPAAAPATSSDSGSATKSAAPSTQGSSTTAS